MTAGRQHIMCGSPFLCIRSHDTLANARTVRICMCVCAGACAVSACLSIKAVDYIDSFRNCAIVTCTSHDFYYWQKDIYVNILYYVFYKMH